MRWFACVVVLLLAGCVSPRGHDASPEGTSDGRTGHPLEGQPAPAYGATDLHGNQVHLGGGPVLLHIWASWCSVCEAEEPALADLHERFAGRVQFVQVSIDDARYEDAMRQDAADHVGEAWWDPQDRVRPLFQVSYQPVSIFIDNGTIDAVWQGQRADHTTLRANPELAATILERIAAD